MFLGYFYNLRTQLILIWALCLRNYQQKIYMFMLRPYKELEKRWDSITVRAFYEGSARLIYTAYDYTVTPDEFLEVLEKNLNAVYTMAETLVNDPQYFKKEAKKRIKEILSSGNCTHSDKEKNNQSA